ncbi:MAG: flagellar basal body P-ring formation chaperone FlgA [Pirellulales bacterium]|nr:flagellar basal body P-ring formation chaperone FlgA [Pirellulales bacterium]
MATRLLNYAKDSCFFLAMLVLTTCARTSTAAEIEVRSQATCSAVIRLGDVAEVFGGTEEEIAKLKSVELGPAPRAGGRQWISIREIQDALWKRNIDYVSHRFSGANRVEVRSNDKEPTRLDANTVNRAAPLVNHNGTDHLQQMVMNFLRERIDANTDWRVQLQLTPAQANTLNRHTVWEIASVPRRPVPGDVTSWLGPQQIVFEPMLQQQQPADGLRDQIGISVSVSLPPVIVSLRYDVRAGTVLTANHVHTQTVSAEDKHHIGNLPRMEDIIGKEVIRTLYAGQQLDSSMIRSPLLIKRKDTVTVVVRNGPIRLRAVGIALADGSLGERVEVESEFQKEHFDAMVVGPGQVEVNLGAATNLPVNAAPQRNTSVQVRALPPTPDAEHVLSVRRSSSQSMHRAHRNVGGANQPTSLAGQDHGSKTSFQSVNVPGQLKWRRR